VPELRKLDGVLVSSKSRRLEKLAICPKAEVLRYKWISLGGTVPRQILAPWVVLALPLFLSASCKQKSKEEAEPTPVASASAAPAETPAATPPPPDTIPPPTQPPPAGAVAAGAPKGESIKGCCAALHKEEANATGAQKSTYTNAANSCDAISKLVSTGVTKKAAALTQLRASLKGAALPAGCN
jgi:hypothetical protein